MRHSSFTFSLVLIVVKLCLYEAAPIGENATQIVTELLSCSKKFSLTVNECAKSYRTDSGQYGRPLCCAYSKLHYCLNETLGSHFCAKFTDKLLESFVLNQRPPDNCSLDDDHDYPSLNCLAAVHWNLIFGGALFVLISALCCATYTLVGCLMGVCRRK